MKRVLTALVLVPLVLIVVLWAPAWVFLPLVAAVALLAVHELFALFHAVGVHPYRWLGLVATAVVVVGLGAPWPAVITDAVAALLAIVMAILIRAVSLPDRLPTSLGDASGTLLGILYPGLFLAAFAATRLVADGPYWLVFLLVVVWLGDTAALYAGRAWGSHRLAPRVSPKKSWEGSLASVVVAAAVGAGVGHWLHNYGLVPLAIVINIAAQLGDLAESAFKRGAGVKDSGTLLPGHGGVLDRIDAMLFAAPVLWFYVVYLRP